MTIKSDTGQHSQFLRCLFVQAFIVAGGAAQGKTTKFVATLLPGARAWTDLAPLPAALNDARASIVGGRFRVTGGQGHGNTVIGSEVIRVIVSIAMMMVVKL